MFRRILIVGTIALALTSMGATRRTANFVVNAPTQEIADRVARAAEQQRKDQALAWLGKEMPPWKTPCPIRVEITMSAPTGATSFVFSPKGGVQSQRMELSGALDRILAGALPHEITHAIFAHHLGKPVPRWADEGGAVVAEDRLEHERQSKIMKKALKAAKVMTLRRLFTLHEYPPDQNACFTFYGQSYSVSRYLIESGGRPKFLDFMKRGYEDGWDEAAKAVYDYEDVEALEKVWLTWARQR